MILISLLIAAPPTFTTGGKAGPLDSLPADWVTLRRADAGLPRWPGGPQAVFANGDRLPGRAVAIEGFRVRFEPAGFGGPTWSLPLTRLSVLWLGRRDGPAAESATWRRWMAGPRRRDAVLLANGDVIDGTLVGLEAGSPDLVIKRRADGQGVRIKRAGVTAVAFNTALTRTRPPRGPTTRLVLADGTRLRVAGLGGTDTLTAKTLWRTPIRVNVGELLGATRYPDGVTYLSAVRPRQFRETPYLSLRWGWRPNRCVTGGPMRLSEAGAVGTYDEGVGMHSGGSLTYPLGGGAKLFAATVGVQHRDDARRRLGSAVVRVKLDGKDCREHPDGLPVSHRTGPRRVRVKLGGAKALTLVVEPGPGGFVQDEVNWAHARLSD